MVVFDFQFLIRITGSFLLLSYFELLYLFQMKYNNLIDVNLTEVQSPIFNELF